jgi:hypothetical protein
LRKRYRTQNQALKILNLKVEDINTEIGRRIDDFSPENYFDKKELSKLDKFVQYAAAVPIYFCLWWTMDTSLMIVGFVILIAFRFPNRHCN